MAFFLLFVGLPLLEFLLLLEVGEQLGFLNTLWLVLGTGFLGASLARWQGVGVLTRLQQDLAEGRAPKQTAVEGVVILLSGVVLLAPGFITDALGLMGLFPPTRRFMIWGMSRVLARATKEGRFAGGAPGAGRAGPFGSRIFFSGRMGGPGQGPGAEPFAEGGIKDATVVRQRTGPREDGPAEDDAGRAGLPEGGDGSSSAGGSSPA